MSTIIFLGPTLSIAEAKHIFPQGDYRPPAGCGDILKSLLDRPEKIILIDGYFHHQPAVWHKEILFALEKGTQVYGASSMGALRAAELHSFGMVGMGKVFEQFRDGILSDDDEVSLSHHDHRSGYEAVSDAMINIRATLQKAHEQKIISKIFYNNIIQSLKEMFYPNRNLRKLLKRLSAKNSNAKKCLAWVEAGHYIDQKKKDAIFCLSSFQDKKKSKRKVVCEKTKVFEALLNQTYCGKYLPISDEEKLLAFCKEAFNKIKKRNSNISLNGIERIQEILCLLFDPKFICSEKGLFCAKTIKSILAALKSENIIITPEGQGAFLNQLDVSFGKLDKHLCAKIIFVVMCLLDKSKTSLFF